MTEQAGPTYGDSAHYDADYFAWQDEHADIKGRVKVERIGPYVRPTDTVIDFGSAGGKMLAGLPGARKIGVELNDAAREASVRDFGLEVYKSLDDGIADVIVSNHTLEHIAAPYEALQVLAAKLKPGGRLVLVVPIEDWRSKHSKKWDKDDIHRHLYTWTPMNLGNLLDESGYEPLELRIVHRQLMRHYDKFDKLPHPVFEGLQWTWSHVTHRQELLAVARPRLESAA